jgi:hypothetical protein
LSLQLTSFIPNERLVDEINLPISLANRDPLMLANLHTVDIDRKPRHINFGVNRS